MEPRGQRGDGVAERFGLAGSDALGAGRVTSDLGVLREMRMTWPILASQFLPREDCARATNATSHHRG